jgi:hypothetical protein
MTEEEKAYEEALRRIRKAERTGALELDLSGLPLNRLPRELARLTSLQKLNLHDCWPLRGDLSPLAGLTSLQSLDLFCCKLLQRQKRHGVSISELYYESDDGRTIPPGKVSREG